MSKANGFDRPAPGAAPYKSQENIYLAMQKLGVKVSYDEFADRAYIDGLSDQEGPLDDAAMDRLWLLIDLKFKFRPDKSFFYTVITNCARSYSFHPVREYLKKAQKKWDNKSRIDTWLIDYAAADDTPFNRAVGRLWMVAAVRRIRQPGCKFDELPVFESAQGMEKSSMLATMAVNPDWFSDNVSLNADSKRVIEQTRGKWIIEICEMVGMTKAEIEHVKAFLSRQTDSARAAYGRLTEHIERAFICAGTTNSAQYLRDLTGNRRFWPVKLGKIDLKALKRDREQLWAEAATLEAAGEGIRLDAALWIEAAAAQAERRVVNPHLDTLARALDGIDAGKIGKADVYDLTGLQPAQRHQGNMELIGEAMKALGWKAEVAKFEGKDKNAFVKGDAHTRVTYKATWSGSDKRYEVTAAAAATPHDPLRNFIAERAAALAQPVAGANEGATPATPATAEIPVH